MSLDAPLTKAKSELSRRLAEDMFHEGRLLPRGLEARAHEEYYGGLRRLESAMQEIVALGFIIESDEYSDRVVYWTQLPNTAPEPWDSFEVEGGAVKAAIDDINRRSQEEGFNHVATVLWHSHYRNQEPSNTDLEFYPGYLVDLGIVYFTPGQRSCAYRKDGVISPGNNESPNATTEHECSFEPQMNGLFVCSCGKSKRPLQDG